MVTMPSATWHCLVVLELLIIKWNFGISSSNTICSDRCICTKAYRNNSYIKCSSTEQLNLTASAETIENCLSLFAVHSPPASALEISCSDISFPNAFLSNLSLQQLSVVGSNLTEFPTILFDTNTEILHLNVSNNQIKDLPLHFKSLNSLRTLDVSHNRIAQIHFDRSLPEISHLHAQGNSIRNFNEVSKLSSLFFIDASSNPVNLKSSQFHNIFQIKQMHLRSVQAVKEADTCSSEVACRVLPPNLEVLDLSHNELMDVPGCSRLLSGLHHLQVLYLTNNSITIIDETSFQGRCFAKMIFLSLEFNQIMEINPQIIDNLHFLQGLVLTGNYLQHLSTSILQHFINASHNSTSKYRKGIYLDNNFWSCDCLQNDLHQFLVNQNNNVSMPCKLPERFQGRQLKSLSASDLTCVNASVSVVKNTSVAVEFDDVTLVCRGYGVPRPIIHWNAPDGSLITTKLLSMNTEQNNYFSLSAFGENLTVKDLRLWKTGIFKCTANNSISTASSSIALSVILGNVGTIIYIIITCCAFAVAIVLNSVNMCMYIHQHVQAKREYRRAVEALEKEERLNPSIRQRSRTTIDESMASLNANRHYGKYDYTCQQMFLDTVIKGAHSVKRTLYDARHSEFSNNVWEYAANLRDRLHIELPTQLPTISMPNISMPTISMPTIPTMQDINTNIEKLGSSMMMRSHNLATSVGSVFTLKRWMWQQPTNNSSDNESKSSDENLDKPTLTSVKVDVHRENVVERDGGSDGELSPGTSGQQSDQMKGRRMVPRPLSNRSDFAVANVRSSKSLPDYTRAHRAPPNDSGDDVLKKAPIKTVTFLNQVNEDLPVEAAASDVNRSTGIKTVSLSVDNPCHSYETSV